MKRKTDFEIGKTYSAADEGLTGKILEIGEKLTVEYSDGVMSQCSLHGASEYSSLHDLMLIDFSEAADEPEPDNTIDAIFSFDEALALMKLDIFGFWFRNSLGQIVRVEDHAGRDTVVFYAEYKKVGAKK